MKKYNTEIFQNLVSKMMDKDTDERRQLIAALFCSCEEVYEIGLLMDEIADVFNTFLEMSHDDECFLDPVNKIKKISQILKDNS